MIDLESLLESIEEDRKIDPDTLDINWVEQADLYFKYSDAWNTAINERNDLKIEVERKKEKIDELKAKLDLEIRKDPDEYDLDKITEPAIESAIKSNREYKKALEEMYELKKDLNEAQSRANRLYSCVASMEQRKTALENLVKLINQQYFSTPSEPRDLSHEYYKKIQKNKKGAKEKIKSRRKK